MKKIFPSWRAARQMLLVAALVPLVGCVDNSVDYGNIDKTVGFRVDSLQVPLGSTERVYASQMLKMSEHIKTDSSNIYYVVEHGKTDLRFDIPTLRTTFDANRFNLSADFGAAIWSAFKATLTPSQQLILAEKGLPIPAHFPNTYTAFDTEAKFNFTLDWHKVFKVLSRIDIDDPTIHVRLVLNEPARDLFRIYGATDLRLELPSYLRSAQLKSGVYTPSNVGVPAGTSVLEIAAIKVNELRFDKPVTREQFEVGHVRISGKINVSTHKTTILRSAPQAGVRLELLIGNATQGMIAVQEVEGIVDPVIKPTRTIVPLKTSMPSFIDSVDASLDVTHSTVRLDLDLRKIEADFALNRLAVESHTQQDTTHIALVQTPIELQRQKVNTMYFHQGDKSYDPNGFVAGAIQRSAPDIVKLVRDIPDELVFNLDQNMIKVLPRMARFRPGEPIVSELDYHLFVPLMFNRGFTLNYERKSADFEVDSLEFTARDVQAELLGTIESTLPIGVEVDFVALDTAGQVIPTINIPSVRVEAASTDTAHITPLAIKFELRDSKDVERMNAVRFRIISLPYQGNAGRALRSDQYIQLRQARLTVSGMVETTLDF
ncbi:MAG: hypothetical protein Q4A44_04965 [Bacteroidales bacterium]|nr:hypothetical protein [Bacteroidales bacterium]